MAPLRTAAETAIPGEGAAFFLLSREEHARRAYCAIGESITGLLPDARISLSDTELLVLGADGRAGHGRGYAEAATKARVACYTPLYGSTPAGPAFDAAAAALVLEGNRVFASPEGGAIDFPARVAAGEEPLDASRVRCLALGDRGTFGLASLGAV
jgi:3-oxoacyl-[acyl-carrier-protein] synthase II